MDINEHDIRTAFDSEGTLSPVKHLGYTTWALSISNTDLHWLELLQEYLIQRGYHPKMRTSLHPDKPKWHTSYNLQIERVGEMARFIKDFPPLTAHRQKRAAEYELWMHRPRRNRGTPHHRSTVKAVEQMLKHSRRML